MDTTNIDPGAKLIDRDKLLRSTEVPFYFNDGTYENVPCGHASRVTAVAQQEDDGDPYLGIIAMANRSGAGMMAVYTADEVRAFSRQLEKMADYIDVKNAK